MAEKGICGWCRASLAATVRADSVYCSKRCRQASWRFGVRRCELEATDRVMRFAYADPPYPGKAGYYVERQEVDHASLLEQLDTYSDGWALSTSSEALRDVLLLCPPGVRVCAWARPVRYVASGSALQAWEPLIVCGGRRPLSIVVEDTLIYRGRYHSYPGALVGMKPPQFAEWMFKLLGARAGDQLIDLFPGSGAVGRAWGRYSGDVSLAAVNDVSLESSGDVSLEASGDVSLSPAVDVSRVAGADVSLRTWGDFSLKTVESS